jgi:Domain of unknown function DUF1829/Domain of unknown function DUF1828
VNQGECQQVIDDYLAWLRRGIQVQNVNGACEMTTPFLDRHNDHLQVYVTRSGDAIRVSDDGYILADLEQSGLEISTPKRGEVLASILNGFGVKIQGEELFVEASPQNLSQRAHSLVQAMLAVNDMYVMAQPRVASFFWEDVQAYFDRYDVRYSPRVKIPGVSGFDHAIDFVIPKSRQRPERLVQAINYPSKNTIASYLFALTDTRQAREAESEAYAFLNDMERTVGGDVIEALEAYNVTAVPWSVREQHLANLAN